MKMPPGGPAALTQKPCGDRKKYNRRPRCRGPAVLKKRKCEEGMRLGSVKTCALSQSRHFILKFQFAALQFAQFEILRGLMPKRLRQFIFKHPMPLFEFCKIRR